MSSIELNLFWRQFNLPEEMAWTQELLSSARESEQRLWFAVYMMGAVALFFFNVPLYLIGALPGGIYVVVFEGAQRWREHFLRQEVNYIGPLAPIMRGVFVMSACARSMYIGLSEGVQEGWKHFIQQCYKSIISFVCCVVGFCLLVKGLVAGAAGVRSNIIVQDHPGAVVPLQPPIPGDPQPLQQFLTQEDADLFRRFQFLLENTGQ